MTTLIDLTGYQYVQFDDVPELNRLIDQAHSQKLLTICKSSNILDVANYERYIKVQFTISYTQERKQPVQKTQVIYLMVYQNKNTNRTILIIKTSHYQNLKDLITKFHLKYEEDKAKSARLNKDPPQLDCSSTRIWRTFVKEIKATTADLAKLSLYISDDVKTVQTQTWIVPYTPRDTFACVKLATKNGLIGLNQLSSRTALMAAQNKKITNETLEASTICYYWACFLLIIDDQSAFGAHLFEVLEDLCFGKSNINPFTTKSTDLDTVRELTTTERELVQRSGILFILSSVKPSINSGSPKDQGPKWEAKRFQAFLASLGKPTNVTPINGLNDEMSVMRKFWDANVDVKNKVLRTILWPKDTNGMSEMVLAIRSQLILIAQYHDTLIFSMALKFAKNADTEAHLIPEVLREVRAILDTEKQLLKNLNDQCKLEGIQDQPNLAYYTIILPRDAALAVSLYPCLVFCVNSMLSSSSVATLAQVTQHKISVPVSEERIKNALKIQLKKAATVSGTLKQDDVDLLTSLGVDTGVIMAQPAAPVNAQQQFMTFLNQLAAQMSGRPNIP